MSVDPLPVLYEDRFHAVSRRVDRLRRAVSWRAKGWRGKPRTVLVEINWRLGDEIMALPVYEAIKNTWPDARLVVHCTHAGLLEGNPWVDAVNENCEQPDRYICLRSASRTERRIAHYARLAGVAAPAAPPTLYLQDWESPLFAELPDAPIVALAAGATWPTKRWSHRQWHELLTMLRKKGIATVELGQSTDERISTDVSLIDRTSVRDAACVLRRACLFVGSDSGLMHLALAVDTPVVALFGPTDPAVLVGEDPRLLSVTNERPCQGCWNGDLRMHEPGICPLSIPDCLETITPAAVFAAIQTSMEAKKILESGPCASSS